MKKPTEKGHGSIRGCVLFAVQAREGGVMAARLTDKDKKKIIADYVQLGSYNAVSKINGVSATTVKNIIKAQGVEFAGKCEQKKEENAADILAYMESQKSLICEIIGKGLTALNDPEKLATATPAQITTALGTLIDKWVMVNGSGQNNQTESHNALIEAIRKRNNED